MSHAAALDHILAGTLSPKKRGGHFLAVHLGAVFEFFDVIQLRFLFLSPPPSQKKGLFLLFQLQRFHISASYVAVIITVS